MGRAGMKPSFSKSDASGLAGTGKSASLLRELPLDIGIHRLGERALHADRGHMQLERILRETQHNLSRAARILDIDRTTLYNKLRRYGLR